MGIQLVGDEYPLTFWVALDQLLNMRQKIRFGAGVLNRRENHFVRRHFKVGNQGLSTMTLIFKLNPFNLSWLGRVRRMYPFHGLDTRFFIHANDMNPLCM